MLTALQQILANLGFRTDLATVLVLFGLVFARISIAIGMTPFLGGRTVSTRVKVGLSAVLAALLLSNLNTEHAGPLSTVLVMCLLIKEALIGATLGFLSQIIFNSIQMAGAVIDYGRGMSQATFFAPQLETNTSLLGNMQLQGAIVIFLVLNGHLLFLRALARSFETMPILSFPGFTQGTWPAAEQMAHYTSASLTIAVQLAAPVLVTLFLIDASFGMLGRVASGLQAHHESQPVKSLVGLGVILLALGYIFNRMPEYFAGLLQQISQFMQHLR
jgi:flagellar biosynthesis protein FliR